MASPIKTSTKSGRSAARKIAGSTRPRYTTAYRRAKAKAYRLGWQDAAETALIPVKAIIQRLLFSEIPFAEEQAARSKNAYPKKKLRKSPLYTPMATEATAGSSGALPYTLTSKRDVTRPGKKSVPPFSRVLSYQFTEPVSKAVIVVKAFYYPAIHTFMLKFYNKNMKSLNKYAVRTGKGGFRQILHTCFAILTDLTGQYPGASFGFMGERSFFKDKTSGQTLLEPTGHNQRYRIYHLFLAAAPRAAWLRQHFIAFDLEELSTCLLLSYNDKAPSKLQVQDQLRQILSFMAGCYPTLNYAAL